MGMKEAYQEKIEAQLREWTAKINELKAKAEGAKADAKIEMHKRIGALRVKQEETQAKFQALKQAGTEKWEQLRTGLDKAMDDKPQPSPGFQYYHGIENEKSTKAYYRGHFHNRGGAWDRLVL